MAQTPVSAELQALPVEALVNRLFVLIYEPPLSALRESIASCPESLRVFMLIADFDTEVSMNGIVGFLENSTGHYLQQTIEAFELIGAHETASTLRQVDELLRRYGIQPRSLERASTPKRLMPSSPLRRSMARQQWQWRSKSAPWPGASTCTTGCRRNARLPFFARTSRLGESNFSQR
jgi:Domain of unknown function (DUF4375)